MRKQKKLCKNFNKHLAVPFLILIFFAVLVIGCGKKAPPVPPRQAKPSTVNDVCASINGATSKLTWTINGKNRIPMPNLTGFILYSLKMLHLDSNSKNFPVLFKYNDDIRIEISNYE